MKNLLTFIFTFILLVAYGQDSPGKYTIKNASINTQSSDFGTAFFGDDKVVFASPKQGFTLNREETTNQPFLDLYIGEVTEDGQIIRKQKLEGDINSKYHEGMVSFTKDMKTVYFSGNHYVKQKKNKKKVKSTVNLQLFRANISEDGEWINLVLLPFNGDKFSSGHPVLNRDDTQLYFVSDRPESLGKTDLFVVDIHEDGSYSEPRNLGSQINTVEREMFPFIGKDNVLYFSSDGYPGFGELDVYASKIFDSTVSVPINLEEPVNSEFDDFAYIIDDHKHRGYFSSNRGGGHGDDDIYSFTASPPIYIECQQEISGVVRDMETQALVPDVNIILYDAKGLELQSFISSKQMAAFEFQQPCNTTYTIRGYLEGHLVGELDIETVNDLNADPIEITLNLDLKDYKKEAIVADLDAVDQQDLQDQSINQEAVEESAGMESFSDSEEVYAENGNSIKEGKSNNNASTNQKSPSVNSTNQASSAKSSTAALATVAAGAHQSGQDDVDLDGNASIETTSPLKGTDAVNGSTTSSVSTNTSEVVSMNKDSRIDSHDTTLKSNNDQSKQGKAEEAIAASDTSQEKAGSIQTNSASINDASQETEAAAIAQVNNENQQEVQSSAQPKQENEKEAIAASNASNEKAGSIQANSASINNASQETEAAAIAQVNNENQQKDQSSTDTNANSNSEIAMNNESDTNEDSESRNVAKQTGSSGSDLIHINTIYFDYNKYDIRMDAKIELEKIAVVLKKHPESKLKVNAHTDIRGKEAYNMTLSKNRAKHTIQYLLDQGIEVGRISGEGHGETQVVEKCTKQNPCSGLQHQLNRRSEFLVIDNISDIIIAKSINKKNSGNYAISEMAPNSGVYLNYDFSKEKEVYTVQIGAFKGELQNDKYKKLTNLFNYKYEDGLNRYYAGIFESSTEARSYLKEMKKQGFSDAFVVGLKGTNRF